MQIFIFSARFSSKSRLAALFLDGRPGNERKKKTTKNTNNFYFVLRGRMFRFPDTQTAENYGITRSASYADCGNP